MSVADTIKADEGWNPHVYKDALGFYTLGFGFLVDPRQGDGLPKEVGEFWLNHQITEITAALTQRWPPYVMQPTEVQDALTEMAYQIGLDGLLKFGKMLEALTTGNRQLAATEALDSLWAKQTPERAQRVARLISGGSSGQGG